jgi:succinylglutamate desuccinylase
MQHTLRTAPPRPDDLGDPASPHYPRPFNPAPPYAHGFPIEVEPVPIGRWADGNTGIPFLWSFEAARPGPHVALVALTHGEEICGAYALDLFLREGLRPARGRLSFLFNNWRAHERWDPAAPNRAFYVDHDMNRIWQRALLDGPGDGVELERARELRPFIESVDVLVDLHSTQQPSPPMTLPGWPARKARFARALGWPGLIVRDDGPGRLRDWGALGAQAGARTGLVVECGQHWVAGTGANAVRAAVRLLAHLGLVDWAALIRHGADAPVAMPRIAVVTHTIRARSDAARLDRIWPDIAEIPEAGTLLGHDGVEEIRTPYDDALLIMPVARPRAGAVMVRIARDDETLF